MKLDDLEAIIISHGHEDHAGAVAYFTEKIKCPIYVSVLQDHLLKID